MIHFVTVYICDTCNVISPTPAQCGGCGKDMQPAEFGRSVDKYEDASLQALNALATDARRIIADCETGGDLFVNRWSKALGQARLVIAALDVHEGIKRDG